jgi:hypothetical protein
MDGGAMRSTLFFLTILISIFIVSCGAPVEEIPPTPIPTKVPTQPPPPTETPSPISEPTSMPVMITTFDDIVGLWTRTKQGHEWRLQIQEDGSVSDWVGVRNWYAVNFRFEEGLLYVNYVQDIVCTDIGTYEVTGVPSGYLTFTLVEDECAALRGLRGKWNYASTP